MLDHDCDYNNRCAACDAPCSDTQVLCDVCDDLNDYVNEDYDTLGEYYEEQDWGADDMDGDHETGLSSAGFGTDEDYGDYGGEY